MLNKSTSCQLYVVHEVFRPRGRERERKIKREIVKYCFTCSTQRAAQCKILQVVKLHPPSLSPSLPPSLPPSLSPSLPPSLSHFISDSTMNLKAVPCNKSTTSTLLFMRSSTKSKNSGYVILPSVPVLITYSRLGWSVFLPGLIQCPQWLQFDFMLLVKDWEGEVLPQDGVMNIIQTM